MKKVLLSTAIGLSLFVAFLWITMSSSANNSVDPRIELDLPKPDSAEKQAALNRLATSVQLKTVSARGLGTGKEAFLGFNSLLTEYYPQANSILELIFKAEHSLLFKLKGQDPNLAPALFIAHSDVVPAQSKSKWQHPPFSGHIDDTFIWGRGTLDNKSAILAMMEALERHAKNKKFKPSRTLYFAFTHDEEVGGHLGARQISLYMKKNKIYPYFVLDEGQAVTQGVVPNIDKPVALIGVTQKGYMTVELSATGQPGHSMLPPKATAISTLSHAIHRLTESPMPPKMTSPVKAMFRQLSHNLSFPKNLVLFHTWLTEPLMTSKLSQKRETDALIRSSMSVNVIEGGIAENVLPEHATALVNYRIAPHNSSQDILSHIHETLSGINVQVSVVSKIEEPAPITNHNQDIYRTIESTIQSVFPGSITAPSITLSTTDSRHFADITDNIFRFCPIFLLKEDLPRFHGINERISHENYFQMIEFYQRLFAQL